MSAALYSTLLLWAGTHGGLAKLHGRQVKLTVPPNLPGLRVEQIDYRPEIGERRVMPYAAPWRDMSQEECRAADALLGCLCPAAG